MLIVHTFNGQSFCNPVERLKKEHKKPIEPITHKKKNNRTHNSQFAGISTVGQTDDIIRQISPVWSWGSRNVTHACSNERIHFLTNVISKNWLVLTAAHLRGNKRMLHTILKCGCNSIACLIMHRGISIRFPSFGQSPLLPCKLFSMRSLGIISFIFFR